jgi:cytochrome c oxidase assembly protein subunit 11
MDVQDRNRRTARLIGLVVVCMVGLSFASVPLYRLFCQTTGIGGPAQRLVAATIPGQVRDRQIEIRFNADVDGRLPWDFTPEVRSVTLAVGAEGLTAFRAHNRSPQTIVGTAVYNVTPEKAGKYFHKIQCFCFGEQRLNPGQRVDMPVMFYVDPAFADDPNMEDVQSLTLSYIFYHTDSPELDAALTRFNTPVTAMPVAGAAKTE